MELRVARAQSLGRAGVVVIALWASPGPLATVDARQTATPASAALVADEVDGNALIEAGKLQDGLGALARAERIYGDRGDRRGQARVASRQASTLRRLARPDDAVAAATRALALAGDDTTIRVGALTELGVLANDRGNTDDAETWLRQALPLAEQSGDGAVEASVRRALGRVSDRRGQTTAALEHFEHAVAAADRSGDVSGRASSRVLLTVTLLGLARYDDALARAEEASTLAQGAAPPSVRADALFNLAQAQGHVWNLDRAAELWEAAIEAHAAAGNVRSVALATKQSVDTSFARGEFERAVIDGERAVALLRQARFDPFVPETLARLALSETRRSKPDRARHWADQARAELPSAPTARHIFVLNDLGLVALEQGDIAQAQLDFARVRDIAVEIANVEYEWRGWWGLGRALTAAGDRAGAMGALERAIGMVERLRQTIPDAGLRALFMANRVGPYETLVEATLGKGGAANDTAAREALHVAERARGRALADLLAEARARPSNPRLQAIREREIAFGQRLSDAGRRVATATEPAARSEALEALAALEHEYDAFVLEIRRDNAGYAALSHPQALTAADVSRLLAPDEALVEFLMTDTRGFAWVARHDRVRAYDVPGQVALLPRVRLLQASIGANDVAAVERIGADLHEQLLAPAAADLQGVRRLVVVPDGALQRVPFALLRDDNRWLVEHYTLAVAPSATVLEHLRGLPSRRALRPLLAMASPAPSAGQAAVFELTTDTLARLSHAPDEVAEVRARLRTTDAEIHAGPGAVEAVLKSPAAADYRVVHLAAHAIADEVVPRRSAVLLTPGGDDDGLLRVSEIANLSLGADLVVLAACRSNVGRFVRGEGLLSLGRAFLHAGARAVVATAWTVDDRETAWFMGQFYAALGDGLPPDDALARAQRRAIAAGGPHAAPASWAGFLLIGDGRGPIVEPPTRSSARPLLYAAAVIAVAALAVGGLRWQRPR